MISTVDKENTQGPVVGHKDDTWSQGAVVRVCIVRLEVVKRLFIRG